MPYSVYVTAATKRHRDVARIKACLEDPEFRALNKEHNLALCQALRADDAEITALILNQANATDESRIDPFAVPDEKFEVSVGRLVDAALQYASTNLVAILLKHAPIVRYLKTSSRDAFTFTIPLRTFLEAEGDSRTKCEVAHLIANGRSDNLPPILKTKSPFLKELYADRELIMNGTYDQRGNVLTWGFKHVSMAFLEGLTVRDRQNVTNRLPALNLHVMRLIYEMAIDDKDLLKRAVTKAQIIATTMEKTKAARKLG